MKNEKLNLHSKQLLTPRIWAIISDVNAERAPGKTCAVEKTNTKTNWTLAISVRLSRSAMFATICPLYTLFTLPTFKLSLKS